MVSVNQVGTKNNSPPLRATSQSGLALLKALHNRPQPAGMLYRLTGASFGRAGCQVRTGTGHVLRTDLPLLHGGEDTAAQPIEMLLASLCGCKVPVRTWQPARPKLAPVRL